MRELQGPGLRARLLFKAVDRLSGSSSPLETNPPPAGPPPRRYQPSRPKNAREANYEAPPLDFAHLPPRTQCLTPHPDEGQEYLCPKANDQVQSLLLTLPRRALLLIYKEVLGHRLLHVVRRQDRLGHITCNATGDQDECREKKCRGIKLPSGMFIHRDEGNGGLIQLLQTCRTIYADAIPLLYSSNTFDFDSMEGLLSLSCAVLPQRFDTIQSVKLDYRFNLSLDFSETTCFNDWPRWERTWRVLASMGALQRLWLRLSWPKPALYDTEEKRFLEPFWILTHMEVFEVNLPRLKDKEKAWGKGKKPPFTVIRRTAN